MLLIDRINVSVINYLLFLIMNYVVMMMIIIMTLCINTAIYCAVVVITTSGRGNCWMMMDKVNSRAACMKYRKKNSTDEINGYI